MFYFFNIYPRKTRKTDAHLQKDLRTGAFAHRDELLHSAGNLTMSYICVCTHCITQHCQTTRVIVRVCGGLVLFGDLLLWSAGLLLKLVDCVSVH